MQDSIWHIGQRKFREYISTISDKEITIADAIATYREAGVLPKEFRQMTVYELLARGPEEVGKVFHLLRKMEPESKFRFDYKIADRKQELIEIINDEYGIDIEKAKVKIVPDRFDDGNIVFNYALEALVAPKEVDRVTWHNVGTYEFVGALNDSIALDGGINLFSGGNYSWTERKTERALSANSMEGLLHNCGFNSSDYHVSRMRVPCVVYLNLKTPVRDFLGAAGKTHINLNPFANLIAETVSELVYNMPSAKGHNLKLVSESSRDPDQNAKQYLRDYLIEREQDIFGPGGDPMIAFKQRKTQRGVAYHLRKYKMKPAGFEPPQDWGTTLKYIADSIEDVCEELSRTVWDRTVTREMLGIVAGTRGQMMFAGASYPIKYDTIKLLAQKGIAVVVIEKEGVPDLLAPFAKKYGVALVGTQGKFTNYQRDLIEEVKKIEFGVTGCLVDDDADGNAMVRSCWTKTLKIGVSKEDTVTWLQQNGFPDLKVEDVWEEYTPRDGLLTEEDDPYLQHHRIEIDSIIEEVGAESLWKYIVYRLELKEFSPNGFDLDKVVAKPTTAQLYPEIADKFTSNFDDLIEAITADEKKNIIENELTGAEELEDITKKELEIKDRLFKIVESEEKLKPILDDMKHTNEKVELLLKQIQEEAKKQQQQDR